MHNLDFLKKNEHFSSVNKVYNKPNSLRFVSAFIQYHQPYIACHIQEENLDVEDCLLVKN